MKLEKEIQKFWEDRQIFKKTLSTRSRGKKFVFYDGPPFATGLPHYGHILAGTIKDVIPRYQTMRGKYVRREWGWDCHGLPLENIIEQELGLKHKKDIEKFGIENFNEAAKKAVLRYESDWKKIIPQTGRFVEMENPYKTMDSSYTESVWWAFKNLWDKKLIYEGYKVMLVCPRCETTLAQSEVALGGYHDITDISVTVKFELVDEPGTYLLAWTTTPWTLPGNTAIAVNKDIYYVLVDSEESEEQKKGKFIVAKARLEFLKIKYKILKEFKGSDLVGKKYKPVFDYYQNDQKLKNRENGWRVWHADFVTTETGTGIAHEAPAFGEEDMQLAIKNNIPIVQHVGMDGRIKDEIRDLRGLYVKQKGDSQSTDIEVIKNLAHRGLLFSKEKIVHPYPLCWRCDTPLLNYATSSWFVKVTDFKNKLVKENKKITWVPSHMRDGRFGKWLEGAKDWAISRSRYWGAPLPVWKCEECKEFEVIGSLEDLQKKIHKSGNKYFVMRHGESVSNIYGVNDSFGDPNNHLTELGIEQVKKILKKISENKITKIITSPLIRAVETAEIIADGVGMSKENLIIEPRFIEFNHGTGFQGKKSGLIESDPSEHIDLYYKHDDSESNSDVRKRVVSAIFDLDSKYKNENILIVTHGSPMWLLICGALHMSDKETIDYRASHKKSDSYFIKNVQLEKIDFSPFPVNDNFVLDYHRPYIDEVKLTCFCGGEMKRVPEVFDCWFESGSMPYGQLHYPFENKKLFKENFPADFIAEGLDQTRGWFYSMIVLGVALFGKSPYKNVIVNGLILGEDGQKMSKKLKNYPDVMEVIEKYGSDAMRYYMLSSPIMRGEDLNFSEKGVGEIYRKNISRLTNVHTFYETYAHELKDENSWKKSKNILDLWILSRLGETQREITNGMEKYELDTASRPIEKFIDDLSTWYLRRSRERFKGDDLNDKEFSLSITRHVLFELSKLIAPFMPYIAEGIYQKVRTEKSLESVHLENWPKASKIDKNIISKMESTRKIVELALAVRAQKGIKVRQPLSKLSVGDKNGEFFQELIKDEVNVKNISVISGESVELDTNITPELKKEGQVRELLRNIQDLRKSESLTPRDKVTLLVEATGQSKDLISEFEKEIKKATILNEIVFGTAGSEEIKIDELSFKLEIKK